MDQATLSIPSFLRFVGDIELKPCSECGGLGHVACPQTVATRTIGLNGVPTIQPSTGHPVPCPSCMGKKVVTNCG